MSDYEYTENTDELETSTETDTELGEDDFGPEYEPDYDVHSALAEIHSEQEPEKSENSSEDKQDDQDEAENEADTDDDEGEESEDQTAESDDDDSDFELDAELAKVPGATKRWQEQLAGLEKVKSRYQELSEKATPVLEWAERFDNKETAVSEYKQLARLLSDLHGIPVEQFIGDSAASHVDNNDDADLEPWEKEGFVYQDEYDVYTKAKQDAKAELLKELDPYLQELKATKQQREQERIRAERESYLDKVTPRTQKLLAKTENGWTVTREMVEKALDAFPQLADEPARAVKAYYADELKAHTAKVVTELASPKAPEILPKSSPAGRKKANEDWDAYDIRTALTELQQD